MGLSIWRSLLWGRAPVRSLDSPETCRMAATPQKRAGWPRCMRCAKRCLQSLGCCRCAKRNIAVVDIPGLHAKVYIGQKGIVVASANTSADGLGEEDDILCDGLEAGH